MALQNPKRYSMDFTLTAGYGAHYQHFSLINHNTNDIIKIKLIKIFFVCLYLVGIGNEFLQSFHSLSDSLPP
jgi:hypothetical protein